MCAQSVFYHVKHDHYRPTTKRPAADTVQRGAEHNNIDTVVCVSIVRRDNSKYYNFVNRI